MARPRISDDGFPGAGAESDQQDSQLQSVLEELRAKNISDAYYLLYRKSPDPKAPPGYHYIGKFDWRAPEGIDFEEIKRQFGGGDYQFQVKDELTNKIVAKGKIAIDPRIKGVLDENTINSLGMTLPAKGPAAEDIMAAVRLGSDMRGPGPAGAPLDVMALLSLQQRQAEIQAQAAEKNANSMLVMMTKSQETQMAMMVAMVAALGGRRNEPDPLVIELLKQRAAPAGGVKEIIDGMRDLNQLKGELTNGAAPEPEEDTMTKIMKMLGPLAGSFLAGRINGPTVAGPGVIGQTPLHGASGPAAGNPLVARIKFMAGFLVDAARTGADPNLYADMLLNWASTHSAPGNDLVGQCGAWLNQPNCVEQLVSIDARFAEIAPWLAAVRQSCLDALAAPVNGNAVEPEPESVVKNS